MVGALAAVAGEVDQAIIDADAEANHGDEIGNEERDAHRMQEGQPEVRRGKEAKQAEGTNDAERGDDDGNQRRQQRAENDEEDQERHRQSDEFAGAERLGRGEIEIEEKRRPARDPGTGAPGKRELGDIVAEERHDVLGVAVGVGVDGDEGGVPIRTGPVLDHHVAVGDLVDFRIAADGIEQRLPGGVGVCGRNPLRVPDNGGGEGERGGEILDEVDAHGFRWRALHPRQGALHAAGEINGQWDENADDGNPEDKHCPGAAARVEPANRQIGLGRQRTVAAASSVKPLMPRVRGALI